MKLLKNSFTLIFFIYAAGVSFGQNKLAEKITEIPASSKQLDIPKYENGKPFVYWHFCKQKEMQLNLGHPETSTDSLLVRVWVTVPTRKKGQRADLFEMRYTNNEWTAQVVNMSIDFKKSNLQETISNQIVTIVKPLTDWKNIVDSLFLWKIDSLPTDERLPDYASKSSSYANRAPTFSFEYSTPTLYRFYQYNNVWAIQDYYWQADNVVKITNLIDSEFHVDSLANEFYEKKIKK